MSDPEIDAIGKLLEAKALGDAASLDSKAWRRLMDYSISLFSSAEASAFTKEKEAREAAKAAERIQRAAEREARIKADPTEDPDWHVLRHGRSA